MAAAESNQQEGFTKLSTDHATVTISHFGAHVTSWCVKGEEVMFLSKDAIFDGETPIRGGVPLIFPQFGPGKMRQHGFARRCAWTCASEESGSDKATAVFTLEPNEYTLNMWPCKFLLTFTVTIDMNRLLLDFNVKNTTDKAFEFTSAFHTYFISDVETLKITGLKGKTFADSLKERAEFVEDRDAVTIAENVDRIYRNVDWPVMYTKGSKMVSISSNVKDCVVWNPWIEKAKAMKDFGDEEYKTMVCVEPGACLDPITVGAGDSYSMTKEVRFNVDGPQLNWVDAPSS